MAQTSPMQQIEDFQYGYILPLVQMNKTGKNSGGNAAKLIKIPNLDDPMVIERVRRESMEQSENNEVERKLELIEE